MLGRALGAGRMRTLMREIGARIGPPRVDVEWLALLAALWISACNNDLLWHSLATHDSGLVLTISVFVLVTATHALLFCLLLVGPLARPLLTVLLFAAAAAGHATGVYGVLFDGSMLRNVLVTEPGEARELLSPDLLLALAAALPAVALVWWPRRNRRPPLHALLRRAGWIGALSAVLAATLWLQYWPVSSLVRSEPRLRHAVAPVNLLAAAAALARQQMRQPRGPLLPVGLDARVTDAGSDRRPRALVLVIGETVRAQDWGLSGYARQTTPELAQEEVVNFTEVTACGTATEVSLPCMFALDPIRGRDPALARRSESLLHLLAHAGIETEWRDNQTGCKGVCTGLPFESLVVDAAEHCELGRCLDDALFAGLERRIDAHAGDVVIVLHMLGNHGPAYSERYPPAFARFLPACQSLDLTHCDRASIRNAYDNAVLYTDHLLADAIGRLKRLPRHATALLYVSDHGESLGENGLYLHGMPRAFAPIEQTRVPMLLWRSSTWQAAAPLDRGCVAGRANAPASHAELAHTVLGLMHVASVDYAVDHDVLAGCAATKVSATDS